MRLTWLPDLRATGLIRLAPAIACTHQAHGELFPDAVVGVELVSRQWIQIPQQVRALLLGKVAPQDLESRGIVVRWHWKRNAVRRVLRHAEAEAVDHDVLVPVFIGTSIGRGDEGQWQ